MRVHSLMTACPHKVQAEDSVERALELMALLGIRHLPVTKADQLVGLLSKRDLELAGEIAKATEYRPSVEEICTGDPLVVLETDRVADVAKQMAEKKLDCVLVKSDDETVTGIVTTVDVCTMLHRLLDEQLH